MPVIAAGITTKTGKIVLSRHFMDVTRIRIEGLLSAFPKLLSTGSKQSTFIETGTVRYVYQPVENMYLVLVTTKNSNIVEDLATLRLLGRLLPEYVPALDEETIASKAFEVLFAFDEVITGGHRENVTLEQVVTYLEMQSHEEELAKQEKIKAIEAAKKQSKIRAKQIAQTRRDNAYQGGGDHDEERVSEPIAQKPSAAYSDVAEDISQVQQPKKGLGMGLRKGLKQDHASKVLLESGLSPSASSPAAAQAPASTQPTESVHIKIEEKISAVITREGTVSGLDIKGDLFVTVLDASMANIKLLLGKYNEDFAFKTHPNINKALFSGSRTLAIKDGKPYPTQQALGIVRWRLQTVGKVKVPITVNCWPGDSSVTVEYELENPNVALENARIRIPIGSAFPTIDEISEGSYNVDSANGCVVWEIPHISASDPQGNMDISLNVEVPPDTFFPTTVQFTSQSTLADVKLLDVRSTESDASVPHSTEVYLLSDEYGVT